MSYFQEESKEELVKMQSETMESMGIKGKDNIIAAMAMADKAEEMERDRILKIIKSLERRNCFGVTKYIDKNKLNDAILQENEK